MTKPDRHAPPAVHSGPARVLEQASKNFQTVFAEHAQFAQKMIEHTGDHATKLADVKQPQEILALNAAYCQATVGMALQQMARAIGLCSQLASEMAAPVAETVSELQDAASELSENARSSLRAAKP